MSTDIPPSDDFISEEETEYFEWLYQQGYNLVVGLLFGGLAHVLVRLYSSNGKQKESNPIDEKLDQMILGGKIVQNIACKMVFVVRTDIGMGKGKMAAQVAHAALACYKAAVKRNPSLVKRWELLGQTKVCVKLDKDPEVDPMKELKRLKIAAEARGLTACYIRDAGHTQVESGTVTVLGIGPGPQELVDSVTGHLKLL